MIFDVVSDLKMSIAYVRGDMTILILNTNMGRRLILSEMASQSFIYLCITGIFRLTQLI